jgi:aspartyl-tRNA(Asn)/glutamyl-tRNA(Gln) amidotransferase subunit B
MRSKETSDDYRYFPEPDLPPLRVDEAWLERLRAALPELPAARRARYASAFGLTAEAAALLAADPDAAALFERVVEADESLSGRSVANWVAGEYLRLRNAAPADAPIVAAPAQLAELIGLVEGGALSRSNAKEVFEAHVRSGDPVAAIVADRGLQQISDAGLVGATVDEVIAANPAAVADYRAGKVQAIGFLVGQVMKATRGQADAAVVQRLIRERLDA